MPSPRFTRLVSRGRSPLVAASMSPINPLETCAVRHQRFHEASEGSLWVASRLRWMSRVIPLSSPRSSWRPTMRRPSKNIKEAGAMGKMPVAPASSCPVSLPVADSLDVVARPATKGRGTSRLRRRAAARAPPPALLSPPWVLFWGLTSQSGRGPPTLTMGVRPQWSKRGDGPLPVGLPLIVPCPLLISLEPCVSCING